MLAKNLQAAVAGQAAGGYTIDRSLRFNSADSAYLSRTPGSAGNRKTWTWSGWVKKTTVGSGYNLPLFGVATDSTNYTFLHFYSNAIRLQDYSTVWRGTTALYRDVSAWYHIVCAVDTTQATGSNRVKLYVNGVQVTAFDYSNDPTQNADLYINTALSHRIGNIQADSAYGNGYLADINFIDGTALDPSSFGEYNATTGVWQPIAYAGSYGTNGFHLDFNDISSTVGQLYKSSTLYTTKANVIANATAISGGASVSGEYLYFVPNGSEVTGANVFTSNGSMSSVARYFYYSGGSWVQTSGSYGTTEFTSMKFGADSSNYQLSQSRDFYVISGSGSVDVATGTVPTLLTELVANDQSGAGNNWLTNNISVTAGAGNDSLVDTPTQYGTDTGAGGEVGGNYCTLNPLPKFTAVGTATPTNGNLDVSGTNKSVGTLPIDITGKWYYEVYVNAAADYDGPGWTTSANFNQNGSWGDNNSLFIYAPNGSIYNNGWSSGYSTYTAGDIIGVGWDSGTVKYYKNGSLVHSYSSGVTAGTVVVPFAHGQSAMNFSYNFGQRPFAYTAPSGFKALCTTNLPTPDVVQGDTAFNTVLYTGNGSTQSITGVGFQPDLVWVKSRSAARNHHLNDAVRGATYDLESSSTSAEAVRNGIVSFDSDGFSVSATDGGFNNSGDAFVGWNWKAGGSGVSNTDGSITSTVSANPTAGISVVTYAGNGSTGTVGHGLGAKPSIVIVKDRTTGSTDWRVFVSALNDNTKWLGLNSTAAATSQSNYWNGGTTSSVFGVGNWSYINASGDNYVAYCFAPVEGFSAFGSYTGNGSTDGPFVYTGFRPAFVMLKQSSTSGNNWRIVDTTRKTYNIQGQEELYPNTTDTENAVGAANYIDIISNGFKLRNSLSGSNSSGSTYVYMAFAENPFKYSLGR